MRMLKVALISLALFSATVVNSQTVNPPAAPLPAALSKAHKLFIGNAGDQDNADCLRVYNDFYAGVGKLARFELVADPNDADLVLDLHYEIDLGASIVCDHNKDSVRQFRVVLLDPHSHITLWTLIERTNYAVFQRNRNRNLDDTVAVLVGDVNQILSPQPIAPNTNSKPAHN